MPWIRPAWAAVLLSLAIAVSGAWLQVSVVDFPRLAGSGARSTRGTYDFFLLSFRFRARCPGD